MKVYVLIDLSDDVDEIYKVVDSREKEIGRAHV